MARFLAPIALIGFAVAVAAVILSSQITEGDTGTADGGSGPPAATETTTAPGRTDRRGPATYIVRTNDTLSGIAEQTGVSLERIQELNPDLDPQGLVAGQRIRLRE